jgi:hypothetical protein
VTVALERLLNLDRRWIFLAVAVVVSFPFIHKVNIGIVPSPEVIGFYEAVEALPPGSTVYLAADLDPGSQAELLPMLRTAVHQLALRDVRIVGGCLWPAAPPLLERVFAEVATAEHGKVYGTDFVNLGFKEGREAVMVLVAEELRSAYPTDYYGTSVADLPLLADVRSFADVSLLVSISAGYPGTKEWVQQVQGRFSIPMVSGCTAVSAPEYYPYVQANQLQGLLGGMAGAAEYEVLNGVEGDATPAMDAQSLGHLVVLFFIVLGNVLHWVETRRGRTT